MFNPKSICDWYRNRPTWQKYLLFIVFIIAIIVSIIWVIFRSLASTFSKVPSGGTGLKEATGAIEDHFNGTFKHAESVSGKIDQNLEEETKLQERLKEERENENKKANDEKKVVGGLGTIGDVVDSLNKRRGPR